MLTVEYRPEHSRRMAREFLAATSDTADAVWRSMPADWTPATRIASDLPQSTVSSALARLRSAGAVETRRKGRTVLYRPRNTVVLHVQIHRDLEPDTQHVRPSDTPRVLQAARGDS